MTVAAENWKPLTATVMLTGFEPLGGESINPSWLAVQAVARDWAGPEAVHVLELPVAFRRGNGVLVDALAVLHPQVMICVGQAGGAPALHVERVEIKIDDAWIFDSNGSEPTLCGAVILG